MDIRVKSLKILSEQINNASEIESSVLNIKGVVDCKIKNENNSFKIDYALDNWASDYDVMVSIMELLQNEYSLESEPYFDDEEESEEINDFDYYKEDSTIEHDSENNCEHSINEHEEREHHCSLNHGCSCSHSHAHSHDGEFDTTTKGKIIELGVSLAIFLVGLILSFITATKNVAPYIIVVAYSIAGYEILFEGLIGVFRKKFFTENLLMSIASISAILLGQTAEAYGIMFLFAVGELFEHSAIDNSQKVIDSLKKMCPNVVTILKDGIESKVDVKNVKVGDVVVLRAGDKVAIDGKIIKGSASFDSKTVTGESKYKDLDVGEFVYGGYVNVNGYVEVESIKTYNNSTLSRILDIVENSQLKKSKKESFIEKFAKWYTPTVFGLALVLAFIPPFFSVSYLDGLMVWGVRGIMLLCVSCPCALVISVPLTYFCGVGAGAKKGVLIKSTNTLEKLSSCDTVVFDKTGTLTKGELKVTKIISTKKYSGKLLEIVAVIEKNSNHPIAKAIKEKAGDIKGEVSSFKEVAGKGIIAEYNGDTHILGNYNFLKENQINFKDIEEIGTKLYLAINGEFAGAIVLNDEIRDEAYGAIRELRDYGVYKTVMLTGDSREYAKKIRQELKMSTSVSELMPEDKVKEIEKLIEANNNKCVAYVGDGINDAPVITRSDVGFAMGALGSDTAIDSADIILTDDDLSKVPYTVRLAKRTNKIAKQNIIGSLLVKGIIMVLGAFGITTSLWLAITADVGVMILAVLNAIRNRID
ncbi:MAG: cadmium-translocating P-type ATPase [Clostridia bacterium]|nr:cadmium-translocating P-type ATPase [Clostridia bacterium]